MAYFIHRQHFSHAEERHRSIFVVQQFLPVAAETETAGQAVNISIFANLS